MQRKVSYVILPFFSFVFFSSWGYNVRPKPTVPRCVWVGRLRLTISWHKTGQAVHESGERRACGHRLTPLGTSRPHGSPPKKHCLCHDARNEVVAIHGWSMQRGYLAISGPSLAAATACLPSAARVYNHTHHLSYCYRAHCRAMSMEYVQQGWRTTFHK